MVSDTRRQWNLWFMQELMGPNGQWKSSCDKAQIQVEFGNQQYDTGQVFNISFLFI